MEDSIIVELFWQRNDLAIRESQIKYGSYCRAIADNILCSKEDAEECVNDTWLSAWNSIPPQKPGRLSAFFGRIVRNLAIDRYRKSHAQKRGYGGYELCLDELSECVREDHPIEDRLMLKELLEAFLSDSPEKSRNIFLLRYWYFLPVAEIAKRNNISEGAVKMILLRMRNKLKDELEKEGIGL